MFKPAQRAVRRSVVSPLRLTLNLIAAWLLLAAFTAYAAYAAPVAPTGTPAPLNIDDVGRGTLLLRGDDDATRFDPAMELKTVVEIDVAGVVARTVLRQMFENPGTVWREGVYVFPLPETAAVDNLKLRIGDRLIEGRIEERQRARQIYEEAKQQGRKAALMSSERPNMFTTAVANIGPGEAVEVEIQYQERLRYRDGAFRLRFPMVVGPRYIPGAPRIASFTNAGWAAPTGEVPDADRITPPVRDPANGAINPVVLTVRLDAGFALADLTSHHHAIDVRVDGDAQEDGQGRRQITLADGAVPADRDFELTWTPAAQAAPTAGLFVEDRDDGRYVLALLMPPAADAAAPSTDDTGAAAAGTARELIFILDISGSMSGQSIVQAKAALDRALDTLDPQDVFNVIAFNNDHRAMFPAPRPASRGTVDQARGWIDALQAEGGTNMAPALQAALADSADSGSGSRLRQIVFLTDGAVGNEAALFEMITRNLGSSRLFTIGIGSAPNSHFMRGAARAGRGTFTHIGSSGQVAERIDGIVRQLQRPALTDIAVAVDDGGAEVSPNPIPDLYAGEPVVFAARTAPATTVLTVSARIGRDVWRQEIDVSTGAGSTGIARLWARERIADFDAERLIAKDPAAVDAGILKLALEYGLVTRLTSLVAVDVTPSRPDGTPLASEQLPTNLPAGWEFDKVFGETRALRKAARPDPATGTMLASAAAPPVQAMARMQPMAQPAAVSLPNTATPAPLLVLIGMLLLIGAGMVLLALRRRPA